MTRNHMTYSQPSVSTLGRDGDEPSGTAADPEIAWLRGGRLPHMWVLSTLPGPIPLRKWRTLTNGPQHDSRHPLPCRSLKQLFPDFNMCMWITLGSCWNEDSTSVGLGWDPRFYVSNKFQVMLVLLVHGSRLKPQRFTAVCSGSVVYTSQCFCCSPLLKCPPHHVQVESHASITAWSPVTWPPQLPRWHCSEGKHLQLN